MATPFSTSEGADQPLVVGIGGSAGGIEALQHFLEALPASPGAAFVVVMHLAPDETSQLAEVLQPHTPMPVRQVTEPTALETDHVYVTSPGNTLLVEERTLVPEALREPAERRTPIDTFFRSLAGADVEPVGLVVSGSGTDGSVGLRAIVEAGGVIAAQDPGEAAYPSMPRSAIETSRVDFVLPVAELARRLQKQQDLARDLYLPRAPEALDQEQKTLLGRVFEEVRVHTGHDFSQYKQSTMLRRVHRRLHVHQINSLEEYFHYLEEHPEEATALQKDLLISVTNFFRDPETFAVLRDEVLPSLLKRKTRDESVRAWVVGCASGEEAYTVAMLLLEQAASGSVPADHIQVFATDIDEQALATARKGRYPEAIATDVPERYLDRFFRKEGTDYVVRPSVRGRVLFTPHSLLKDPPFSNLDLVSCRNLLIYLRRDLQRSVFDLFGYALNEEGVLLLGSSESADLAEDTFQPIDTSHRLYRRRPGEQSIPDLPSLPMGGPTAGPVPVQGKKNSASGRSAAAQHRRLLEAYAPPSALVNEDYQFVHLSQSAGRYLQHPIGPPSENILKIVRPELRGPLRSALRQAFADDRTVRTEPVTVQFTGDDRPVHLVVRPAQEVPDAEGLALVVFVESEGTASSPEPPATTDDEQVRQLETELEQTKQELRSTVEEYETSQQEMRAANEELRSMNEEYKSMTEELETSKEELQYVNEELTTVNRELEEKVEALEKANSDLKNLMAATDIGTLFLDRELRIQRYTPRIETLFNVQPSDTGRPIGDFTHQMEYPDLEADARSVLDDLTSVEREVATDEDEWFLVRHHPYRTVDDRIDGVVITFVDITRRKTAEEDLRRANRSLKDRSEQVEALSQALTSAEQTERKRIRQILHDDLRQTIFAARMRMDHLREEASLNAEQEGLATRAIELLDEGVEKTRTLSSELDPPVRDQSLRDALEWLSTQMEESYELAVEVETDDAVRTTDDHLRVLLFRLVRELLFNVVKHAEVEAARVVVLEREDGLQLVVEDEGSGFDPSELDDQGAGLGLVNVRERIQMIGGELRVDSAPGEGTRVTICVPWRRIEGVTASAE